MPHSFGEREGRSLTQDLAKLACAFRLFPLGLSVDGCDLSKVGIRKGLRPDIVAVANPSAKTGETAMVSSSLVLPRVGPATGGEDGATLCDDPMIQLDRPHVVVVAEVDLNRSEPVQIAWTPPIDGEAVDNC